MRLFASVVATSALLAFPNAARADNFYFAFSDGASLSSYPGKVTGEVFGLTDNSTGPAAEVVIQFFSPGLAEPFPDPALPIDVTAWTQQSNSFTETNGAITDFTFVATLSTTDGADSFALQAHYPTKYQISPYQDDYLCLDGASYGCILNSDETAGPTRANFTPAPATPVSATPEPSSLILLSTALLGMFQAARGKFRSA